MDVFSSPKWQKIEDLEVTGISRSGRVRKKSSKLMDYESSEDLAEKQKRQKSQKLEKLVDNYDTPGPSGYHIPKNKKNAVKRDIDANQETESSSTDTCLSDYDSEDVPIPDNEVTVGTASESDEENDDRALTIDDRVGVRFEKLEPPQQEISSQANSLYMLEKNKKKIIIKGGKIIGGEKAQRKDKGKARFTAYMLWAKDIRQKLVIQYPDMGNVKEEKTSITKKTKQDVTSTLMKNLSIARSSSRPNKANVTIIEKGRNTVFGTKPIDVAAYLTLLGESLMVIGELLTNHEGEIAISGSLSVLLDSLLCSLGPLICLTQLVPEANSINPVIMSKILDNIVYIMPGL